MQGEGEAEVQQEGKVSKRPSLGSDVTSMTKPPTRAQCCSWGCGRLPNSADPDETGLWVDDTEFRNLSQAVAKFESELAFVLVPDRVRHCRVTPPAEVRSLELGSIGGSECRAGLFQPVDSTFLRGLNSELSPESLASPHWAPEPKRMQKVGKVPSKRRSACDRKLSVTVKWSD